MRLVEGIVGEIHNFVKQAGRNRLRHTAFDRPVDPLRLVAVDKRDAFLFQLLHFLFAHRAAHHIRLAERIPRERLKHLHDLLLIDHASVSDFEDRFQQRMLVRHLLRVMAALDIPRDRLHRPRPVQRHNRRDILDRLRAQTGNDIGDARTFQLEHTHC